MRDDSRGVLGDWDATGSEIRDALEIAVRKALLEHKRAGQSVVVWDRDNDQTIILKPDAIDVSEDPIDAGARPNGVAPHQMTAPSHPE